MLQLDCVGKPGTSKSRAFCVFQDQCGSALIYILIAVALLAALTVSLMEPSNQQTQSQSTTNLVTATKSQIDFINATIQECVLTHPDQDSSLTTTEQKNPPYPIDPTDAYFATSTPAAAADEYVSNIRCPGNPGGSGPTRKNHALMFGGSSGKFLPPPPNLLDPWVYYNGVDGVYIIITSDKTDAFIASAFDRLQASFGECESDVTDNLSGAATNITTDGTPKTCPAGKICFRYWIVRKATAVPACP